MISIRYPGMPQGVDAGSIIDAFNSSHDRAEQQRNEAQAKSVLERYANSLYGGGNQPQTLSNLQGMFQPAAPAGTVTRAPLADVTDYPSQRVAQAFGDSGAPAVAGQGGNITSNGIAGRFLKTVRDGGVTNPYALAAIAATGKAESGFDPKNATRVWSDPSQSGQAGTAGGIMSWRNERLRNLQAFAQQNGDDPNAPSPETQAKFLLSEDPSLIQKLQQAKSPQEAQQLMNNAWRFAGYDQAGGEAGRRLESANAYAQQFGGSPSQEALESLAVGQSTPAGQGVQVADASGAVPAGAMPQGDTSSLLPPREVMAAMFADPVTRPLAAQLAQSVIKMRAGQADPQTQLEYQIAVEKLRQLRDPQSKLINTANGIYDPNTKSWISPPEGGAANAGLTPVLMQDESGNLFYGQTTKDGKIIRSSVPEGAQPVSPYDKKYLESMGAAEGKGRGEARIALPGDIQNADQTVQQIDELLKNPGLDSIVGPADQYRGSWTLGDSGRDALARYNQLKGRAFLQAYGILRGGGQITEVEGQKAQDAMARMDRAQGETEFRQALGDFRDAVQQGVRKLREVAGESAQGGGGGNAAPKGNRTSSGVQWSIDE